ncbi:MAG: hypothetical protein AABY22_30735, partial [Nanoarchaeota archaeon]
MISKIRFRYSWIYDQNYRNSPKIQENLKSQGKEYPSTKNIFNYIKKIEPLWKRHEKIVLKEISKLTGLSWREKEVLCYLIGFGRPFSDPLTLRLYDNKKDFIDTLIHEMIHQIQTQNQIINRKWKEYIEKKYKKETQTTRNHLLVHSVHYKIYLKLNWIKDLQYINI